MQPRLFVFQSRQQSFLKLIIKGRVIGQYDTLRQNWRIRRPYRLFINAAALPCPADPDLPTQRQTSEPAACKL